jgi:molybdenum cofactor biosynthesis enzyme MoaA
MTEEKTDKRTTAEKLQFQLQFMGYMAMVGREKERDDAYVKAQEFAQELINQGH